MRGTRLAVTAACLSATVLTVLGLAGCGSDGGGSSSSPTSVSASGTPITTAAAPSTTAAPATSAAPTTSAPRSTARHTTPRPSATPATTPARRAAATQSGRLPLAFSTGSARQVITVVANSTGSTSATVQAWQRTSAGWARVGTAIPANVGSQGLTTHPSESLSATPIGSYTLTQAFGSYSDPGTALPYRQTHYRLDYWISSEGSLYNTYQHCQSQGCYANSVNEDLYGAGTAYRYAVVIDYNTRNAPGGVHQGKGSAFFLHVSTGEPTAGCVSIPQSRLVSIMRWLTPTKHPRILIGTRS